MRHLHEEPVEGRFTGNIEREEGGGTAGQKAQIGTRKLSVTRRVVYGCATPTSQW